MIIQQTLSGITIHEESSVLSPDEYKPIIQPPFSSILVSTKSQGKYLAL